MANSTLEMVHGMLYGKGLRFGHPSGLARVIAAMTGDHADVIPFFGPQIHDHAMTVAKVPARLYYWNAELLVDTHLAVDRWYGFDSDTIIADAYNFEVEALGGKMIYSDNAMPTVDVSHPLINEASDLDKIGPLDSTKGRIPMAIEVGQLFLKKAPGPFAGGSQGCTGLKARQRLCHGALRLGERPGALPLHAGLCQGRGKERQRRRCLGVLPGPDT